MNVLVRLAVLALTVLPLSAAGQAASPQDPNHFRPPADDTSVGILREVFGANVIDTLMGAAGMPPEQSTALAAGMSVFLLGILALAMIFVIVTTILGAIKTAEDGSFLGKKMSSTGVPLRTFFGTAILLPMSNGFCLVQMLLLYVALLGVGIADRMWTAMVEHMENTALVGRPSIPDARPLAASILRSEVCRLALNKSYQEAETGQKIEVVREADEVRNTGSIPLPPAVPSPLPGYALDLMRSNIVLSVNRYSWREVGPNVRQNPDICGVLSWKQSYEAGEGNAQAFFNPRPLIQAQNEGVERMIRALTPVAEQIVRGERPAAGALERAADDYENGIARVAAQIVKAVNNSRDTAYLRYAESGGWIFAGTYYNHMIAMNDSVQRVINAAPTPSEPTALGKEAEGVLQTYKDALIVTEEYIRNGAKAAQRYYSNRGSKDEIRRGTEPPVPDIDTFQPTAVSIKEAVIDAPLLWAVRQTTEEIGGSNLSHMTQMKNVGDTIMLTGWGIITATALINGAASGITTKILGEGLTFGIIDPEGLVSPFVAIAVLAFTAMMAAGAYLAFYLPMIPFITWITGVIKWLVVVIETVIAGPVWAAAHIHPDGDEYTGRAGPGYMFVISMALRPALMLFGLIIAIVATQPIAHFINYAYMTVVQSAMGTGLNGLGAFLAYTLIYALLMTIMLHSFFALINWLPDNALRMVGSSVGASGIADREGDKVDHVFVGAASQVGGGMMGKAGHRAPRLRSGGNGSDGESAGARDTAGIAGGNDVHATTPVASVGSGVSAAAGDVAGVAGKGVSGGSGHVRGTSDAGSEELHSTAAAPAPSTRAKDNFN